MKFLINRLREPSTWLGLSIVAGFALPPGTETLIAAGAGAVLGVLLPENPA